LLLLKGRAHPYSPSYIQFTIPFGIQSRYHSKPESTVAVHPTSNLAIALTQSTLLLSIPHPTSNSAHHYTSNFAIAQKQSTLLLSIPHPTSISAYHFTSNIQFSTLFYIQFRYRSKAEHNIAVHPTSNLAIAQSQSTVHPASNVQFLSAQHSTWPYPISNLTIPQKQSTLLLSSLYPISLSLKGRAYYPSPCYIESHYRSKAEHTIAINPTYNFQFLCQKRPT
jgi:hypothetical protein